MLRLFAAALAALSLSILWGCQAEKPAADKAEIHVWGSDTLNALAALYPESFDTLKQEARIPADFDYSRLNLVHNGSPDKTLDLDEADRTFLRDAGIISSIAEFCKMDWDSRHFLPLMQWQRRQVPAAERRGYQIAVVGTMHGYAQGRTDGWLQDNDPRCGDVKTVLDGNLFADRF